MIASAYYGGGKDVIAVAQSGALSVVSPIQKALDVAVSPLAGISNYTIRLSSASSKNRRLKAENSSLKKRLAELKQYQSENIELRSLAGFREDTELKTVAARIISRSPTNWQSFATIGIGRADGVKEKQPVITESGIVGQVAEVSGRAAIVQLLDDRRSGVAVEIARTGATGVVSGLMHNRLRLRFIQGTEDIKVGDALMTSGSGGVYPRGLAVGTVSQVDKTPYSLEPRVKVKPSVRYAQLTSVLVILEQ